MSLGDADIFSKCSNGDFLPLPMPLSVKRFYEFGPFRVDAEKRVLLREGLPVSLAPKALDMLLVLIQHRGKTVEKDQLMDLLWPESDVEEANLPQNVSA